MQEAMGIVSYAPVFNLPVLTFLVDSADEGGEA